MSQVNDVRRKPIFVNLKGEEHEIIFSLEAFAEMEERYGSVDAAMEEMNKGKVKDIKFFLWAALLHEDNPPSEKEIAKAIDIRDLKELIARVMQALGADAPSSPDQNPNK